MPTTLVPQRCFGKRLKPTSAATTHHTSQFSLHRALRRLAEAVGCDRKLLLRDRPDGVDCRLGMVEVFGCLGPFKQEIEQTFQIRFSGR